MNDNDIHNHLEELVEEEHRLRKLGDDRKLTARDEERLKQVEIQLDRYWDLLRQRRAREEFNQDPNDVQLRPAKVVENYQQ